jgi:hypothetical protein
LLVNELDVYRLKKIAGSMLPGASEDAEPKKRPWAERVLDRIWMFKRLSDEDYLEMLKKKREHALVQIRQLEEVIVMEETMRRTPRS